MSEQSDNAASEGAEKRRPQDTDLEPLLSMIGERHSLRSACRTLGLDPPSTHRWLEADDGRSQQYAHARDSRSDHYEDKALIYGEAAATGTPVMNDDGEMVTIDPAGYRAYLDGIKWATARMAPKKAPVQRIDLTSRTRQMTDAEIAEEIAAMEAAKSGGT